MTERLKAARKACKFTQQQVADILGIDRSTYTYYETGKCHPSMSNLVKLAALFCTDVLWIIGETTDKPILCKSDDVMAIRMMIKETGMTELSAEERELVGLFRVLKQSEKEEELIQALEKLKKKTEEEK